uniref:Uncharacterized protein n=1 Tax=Myoviridae sp. ctJ2i1 TaxID=2825079 RepID=A0A8S5V1P2_9CAUD|nr:MAG TPA: hypothetical protein [Myoviridae sp. ctJ2i1]
MVKTFSQKGVVMDQYIIYSILNSLLALFIVATIYKIIKH